MKNTMSAYLMCTTQFLLMALFFISFESNAISGSLATSSGVLPGIPGDSCFQAINFTVTTTCLTQVFSTTGATSEPTSIAPNPDCGFYLGNDIWIAVEVPASGKLRIEITNNVGMNAAMAIYTGTCGAFTQMLCESPSNSNTLVAHTINNIDLAGDILYLRFWNRNSTLGGTFNLCAFEPNIPVNDLCENAIELPVNSSCTAQTFNNIYCTASLGYPNPPCGFFAGGDVWFTVEVPASGHLRIERTNISGINAQYTIYSGDCSNLNLIKCLQSTASWTLHDESLANQTLYIRVYNFNNEDGGNFSLCAWEPNIPDNDFCSLAIPIPVGLSCSGQTFSNAYCTAEPVNSIPNPSCGLFVGGDIWFTLTMPFSGHLRIERTNISGINAQYAVYSGDCSSLVEQYCAQNYPALNIHDESLAGQTLYLRVYNLGNSEGGTFSICAWEPDMPDQDFCINAVPLAVNTECTMIEYSNAYCTPEDGIASPPCGLFVGGDIWFTLVMPLSGHLRIERTNLIGVNAQYTLYSGNCGDLELVQCAQNQVSMTIHNESLAGQTLYLRVFNLGNPEGGTFNLCAWEPDIPDNDFCANAVALPVGTSCNMQSYSSAYCTASEPVSNPNPSCGFYIGGDLWFTLTMPLSGHLRIESMDIEGINFQYALYTGTCGSLTEYKCVQSLEASNIHDDAIAGQTLYLRAYNFFNVDGGTFGICCWEPNIPDNDFCANAFHLDLGSPCEADTFDYTYCTSEPSSVAPNPSCAFYAGTDIWYSVTVPANGSFTIEKDGISPINAGQFSVYSGTCGNLTELMCSQLTDYNTFDNPAYAGEEVLLRFFTYGNLYGGTFSLTLSNAGSSCDADFDGNGVVNTGDILLFMAAFGYPSECGGFDLDGNEFVNTSDLLIVMGSFGNVCP